jgi:hypothetical protein
LHVGKPFSGFEFCISRAKWCVKKWCALARARGLTAFLLASAPEHPTPFHLSIDLTLEEFLLEVWRFSHTYQNTSSARVEEFSLAIWFFSSSFEPRNSDHHFGWRDADSR